MSSHYQALRTCSEWSELTFFCPGFASQDTDSMWSVGSAGAAIWVENMQTALSTVRFSNESGILILITQSYSVKNCA